MLSNSTSITETMNSPTSWSHPMYHPDSLTYEGKKNKELFKKKE